MTNEFKIYQLIIFTLSLLLIFRSSILLLSKKKTIQEWIASLLVWISIAILGLYPNLSTLIANKFGIELGLNALLVVSIIILTAFSIKQYFSIQNLETTITRLVREIALNKIKIKNK